MKSIFSMILLCLVPMFLSASTDGITRESAYRQYLSDFRKSDAKTFSLDFFCNEKSDSNSVHTTVHMTDTLFLPGTTYGEYSTAGSIMYEKGSVVSYKGLDVAFLKVYIELDHMGWNYTDYVVATYTPDGFPLDLRILGREGFAPDLDDVYYFRMDGNLDSMVFVSDQASCTNERQLEDYGNLDYEVRRMRYEVREDGRITGAQTRATWCETKERDNEEEALSFADYLSMFRPVGDDDSMQDLFSLKVCPADSSSLYGVNSVEYERLSIACVRRYIPDEIDQTGEKRTTDWLPLCTFRVGKYVVCTLRKGSDRARIYNYPNGENLLIVYTQEGQVVDARLLARDGDIWDSWIGGDVRPFRLQVKQAYLWGTSDRVYLVTDCEYTVDENGRIRATLRNVEEKRMMWDEKKGTYMSAE